MMFILFITNFEVAVRRRCTLVLIERVVLSAR